MYLNEIFEDYNEDFKFNTEFEDITLENDNRYENELHNLTRVVEETFYEDICNWTGKTSYNQGYFFLPSHVREMINNFCIDFFENNPEESISIQMIDEQICQFKNFDKMKNSDECSTSFFLIKDGIENNDSIKILCGLKEKVTANTEKIAVLKGNVNSSFGLLHKSKKFNKPEPRFKHVSFWKKKRFII
ncbi:TPA: hypothetical protein TZY76_000158 [Streptococcus suis]|nr:hypothetical protein [Streptococcus suis]